MILQSLNEYYERLTKDESSGIPMLGFGVQKIHFALVIDREGNLIQPYDLRGEGKNKELIVPKEVIRSGTKIAPNFMWDNSGYVLGADDKGKKERSLKYFEKFKEFHNELGRNIEDPGMRALLLFLDKWSPDRAETLEQWDEIAGGNLVFRLDREREFIHEKDSIKRLWLEYYQKKVSKMKKAVCLVTGQKKPIPETHSKIKGVKGAQSSGASIISFNIDAFTSYKKTQNFNAPVSSDAAFAYTTALNRLLSFKSRQKVNISDTTNVFWTKQKSVIEDLLSGLIDPPADEDKDSEINKDNKAKIKEIRLFLEAIKQGKMPLEIENDKGVEFYLLGLSPNASRISVRFWHISTVGDVTKNIGRHFQDMSIVKQFDKDPAFPGIWAIIKETAVQRKTKNISPLLEGALIKSIITGENYPKTIMASIINRIRADKIINYLRASVLKACLVRNLKMEVGMGLDQNMSKTPYLLGRLFATLEKIQEEAHDNKINRTIRDSFYTSASASPANVFPRLLSLKNHHESKLKKEKPGRAIQFEKLISEIIDKIEPKKGFPPYLKLEDQGLFNIGYYHQRKVFFTKGKTSDKEG